MTNPTSTPDVLAALVDQIATAVAAKLGAQDELVAISPEPLAALGLEHNGVLRLVDDGKLKATRVGRRLFTKRSYLLALVDELPVASRASRGEPVESRDDLRAAVQRAARRQQRKAAQVRESTTAHATAA